MKCGDKVGDIMALDIRDEIFKKLLGKEIVAAITAERAGCLAGSEKAVRKAKEFGLTVDYWLQDGSLAAAGEKIMLLRGNPKQIAQAEEVLIGMMSMASGIATATSQAVAAGGGKVKIVVGAWKKMPPAVKDLVRHAVTVGGASFRIAEPPFLYLDKNYVRIFGGINQTLRAVEHLGDMDKCVQIKGESKDIALEAEDAVFGGATIIMVDSGQVNDVVRVISHLKARALRDKVKIAFGGGIKIEDINNLAKQEIDILDIGLQILNAPLLDMKLDVLDKREDIANHLSANLFEKTELWIEGIYLKGADLSRIADIVAESLQLNRKEVLVIDVQEPVVTIDILRKTVDLEKIAGKEREILEKLAQIENIRLDEKSSIHSEGILGVIAMPADNVENALQRSRDMVKNVKNNIERRVIVFPTGTELIKGHVKDTNSPLIKQTLEQEGFRVSIGSVVDDDANLIYRQLGNAIAEGYGVIITTGGTGAESKDCTVEAVLMLDPEAETPYIIKFQKGTGRHQKEGVRIAVGEAGGSLIISLPGPNDEVKEALGVIAGMLSNSCRDKKELAACIAEHLRKILFEKSKNYHGRHCSI